MNCNIDICYKCINIDFWFYMNCNIDNCEWTWINIYLTTNQSFSFVFKYSGRTCCSSDSRVYKTPFYYTGTLFYYNLQKISVVCKNVWFQNALTIKTLKHTDLETHPLLKFVDLKKNSNFETQLWSVTMKGSPYLDEGEFSLRLQIWSVWVGVYWRCYQPNINQHTQSNYHFQFQISNFFCWVTQILYKDQIISIWCEHYYDHSYKETSV